MKILTQHDMDKFECAHDCGREHPIDLAAACHPVGGTRTAYNRLDGFLYIRCATCDGPVAIIEAAKKWSGALPRLPGAEELTVSMPPSDELH